jgi:hypothetical protein
MSKHADIIKRLEAATGLDRDLDRDIGLLIGGWRLEEYATPNPTMMLVVGEDVYPDHPGSLYPSFTESIDAALGLVERMLPGWGVKVDTCGQAVLYAGGKSDWYLADASSPPFAILIALFRALEAQEAN